MTRKENQIGFRPTPEERKRLEEEAAQQNQTLSDILRRRALGEEVVTSEVEKRLKEIESRLAAIEKKLEEE